VLYANPSLCSVTLPISYRSKHLLALRYVAWLTYPGCSKDSMSVLALVYSPDWYGMSSYQLHTSILVSTSSWRNLWLPCFILMLSYHLIRPIGIVFYQILESGPASRRPLNIGRSEAVLARVYVFPFLSCKIDNHQVDSMLWSTARSEASGETMQSAQTTFLGDRWTNRQELEALVW